MFNFSRLTFQALIAFDARSLRTHWYILLKFAARCSTCFVFVTCLKFVDDNEYQISSLNQMIKDEKIVN
jgi:hypothetical protein